MSVAVKGSTLDKKVQRTKNKHALWPLQRKRKKSIETTGRRCRATLSSKWDSLTAVSFQAFKNFDSCILSCNFTWWFKTICWWFLMKQLPIQFAHSSKLSPFNQTVAHCSTERCRQPRKTPPLRQRCVSARRYSAWRYVLRAKGFNKHERSAAV